MPRQPTFSSASESFPQLEKVSIRTLRPDQRNARTHSKKQTELIAASIREFGFLSPVIIDDAGVILAGHGRVEAAKSIGLTHAPVLRARLLTSAQKRAFVLADNKIAERAGWDRDRLAIEIGELSNILPDEGMDISLTGFEAGEIDCLLADMGDGNPIDSDVLPEPPAFPASNRGDLWLLGKHRLLCADSRDPASFSRLMRREKAAACFCDPPFNVRVKSIVGRGKHQHAEFAFASGEMKPSQFLRFLTVTLSNAANVSVAGAVHFVCMDWRHIQELVAVGEEVYDEMLNLIVWDKTNAGQGSFYRSQHELIGVFRVRGGTHRNNIELGRHGRNRSNVWKYAGANAFGRDRDENLSKHPTVKPVNLVADALLDCTARGDIVLDHFSGSGTAALAAEKTGRVARCIEYEPQYVDVSIIRWQQQTKADAILDGDGRTFDDIRLERVRMSKLGGSAPEPRRKNETVSTEKSRSGARRG